jgi:RHS repeat-associated protein
MVGHRPSDWHVLDLDKDPTPGDPQRVRTLAKTLHDFADDVSEALRLVKGMAGESTLAEWAGKSATVFKEEFSGVPKNLRKLEKSYGMCGDALADFWPKLERAQALADRALIKAREARQDLTSAQSKLSSADSWVTRASKEADKYKDDPTGSKSDADKPDEAKVRAATRDVQHAKTAHANAQSAVDSAQGALDAAKKMAEDARKMRDDAAREAKNKIDEASDAGIQNRSWWEDVGDWFSDNWDTIVAVCKVVVAVVGIIAMIIGGPILGAIVLVAALVVLADTLYKYSKGQASLWDVGLAALDCIPGMKGLTTLGGLAKGAKALGKGGLKAMAKGLGKKGLRREADDALAASKPGKGRCLNGDPVDMVSGEMYLTETDVELPGLLPLTLRRTHLSTYRSGRSFGPSWASTLDERLVLDDEGVTFAAEDGMILLYPVPSQGTSVMPAEGPRFPLDWDGVPGTPLHITDPLTGSTRHFAPPRQPTPGDEAFTLLLVALTDRNGYRVDIDREADGTPIAVRDTGGRYVHVDTEDGRVTALRLRDGAEDTLGTIVRGFDYSPDGDLVAVRDSSGLPLRFEYDDRRRITSWTDRNGYGYRFSYDDQDRCIAGEGDDGLLRCSIAYDADGRETHYTDALGNTTTYQWNELYQLVAVTDPLGHTTRSTWDRYDRLLSRTDARGRTTRYSYDTLGAPTCIVRPDGLRETAENNAWGLPVTVVQADGHAWHTEYDSRGNLTAETDPSGARVEYRYRDDGALIAVTDALGRTALLEPDAAGLPLAATDAEGGVTRYARDVFGRIVAHTSPEGQVTRLSWSPEGRRLGLDLPDGTSERRRYDPEGNLVEYTDPEGRVTRFEYGGFDLLVSRTDPDGSRLRFAYDGQLRVTSVTNRRGALWEYFYDTAGRMVQERDFSGRVQSYRFDAVGRLVGQTNGANERIEYVRDDFGRITEQRTPEGVTRYSYDPLGQVRQVTGPGVKLAYERDARGRILAETCNGATVRSTYDILGRRIGRVTPSAAESVWEYNGHDRPVLLRTAGRTLTFAYDQAGRETERRMGGVALTQTWDTAGRLGTQTLTATDPDSGPNREGAPQLLQHRIYNYRPNGTVASINDLLRGNRVIDVDRQGRVAGVQASTWSERYVYDAAGNVTEGELHSATSIGRAPKDGHLPVRRAGEITYEYDDQGRVTVRRKKRLSRKPDAWRYTWDSQDRLVGVTTPDGTTWTYTYDPFGRRIAKRRLGPDGTTVVEETTFIWDGFVLAEQMTRVVGETPRCTVWEWERDRFSPLTQTERVASPDAPQEWVDDQFYSIVTDLVGTPAELVTEPGVVAWQARTTVWGAPLPAAGQDDAYCPLRFPGQYADPETALHYNYQRHYDPETGQYASLDPLGLSPGPNPRTYVSNPFTAVDPFGLAPSCEEAARAAAAKRADAEQATPGANKNTRPTSAAGLSVPGHQQPFDGASIKGGGNHDLHPDVQAAYDRVPDHIKEEVRGAHSKCGEAEALSKAMRAGVDPRGGVMAAVNVRAAGNPVHGTPKAACSSCQHVLDQLGVTWVM